MDYNTKKISGLNKDGRILYPCAKKSKSGPWMALSLFSLLLFCCLPASAQDSTAKQKMATRTLFPGTDSAAGKKPDSLVAKAMADTAFTAKDTSGIAVYNAPLSGIKKKAPHDPNKATMHSLMLPGWGQIYNRQYWKLPLVWGGLAIPAVIYLKNNSWYKEARDAYNDVYAATQATPTQPDRINNLKGDYKAYWEELASSPSASTQFLSSVQSSRNYYRRNRDYSILWFLILWGVQVADATVFGHLADFDVSPDLSLKLNPTYLPAIKGPGLSVVMNFK